MKVCDTVGIGRRALWLIVVTLEILWMTVLSSCRLGNIRNYLHSTRYYTGGTSATCCIG